MNDEIKEILSDMLYIICKYGDDFDYFEENEIRYQLPYTKMEKLYDYITNLQTIADNRMDTILKIEKYCIEEKEDLISGGEVCEDVLKIVDELKGK